MSIIIGSLAICGFPFLTGFYSKDILLEFSVNSNGPIFPVMAAYAAAALTCLYSIRLHFLSFRGEFKFSKTQIIKESLESETIVVLTILSVLSMVIGYLNSQSIIMGLVKPIMVTNLIKFLPIMVAVVVVTMSQIIIIRCIPLVKYIYSLFLNKSWFDSLYSRLSIYTTKKSMFIYGLIDQKLLE